jgi:hypothetical protein
MQRLFVSLAAICIAGSAIADEPPLLRPSRDVVVEYRNGEPGQAAGTAVTMHFANKGNRLRIDPANSPTYRIYDIKVNRLTIVMTDKHTFEDRPSDPSMVPLYFSPEAAFTRTGTETIAGLSCTTYDANLHGRRGQLCLTADGVILRARTQQGDQVRELHAVNVSYTEQPATLFEPPPSFQNVDSAGSYRKAQRPHFD